MTLFHDAVGHQNCLSCLAFSPNGERILSGSRDGTAKLWDVATGVLLHTFQWGAESITSVAWSPDGKLLAVAGDPPPQIYSQAEAERIFAFRRGERSEPDFRDDGREPELSRLCVYRATDGTLLHTFEDAGCGVTFSLDGNQLAATNWENLLIIDLESGERRSSPRHCNLFQPFYSEDGSQVACAGYCGIYVFDSSTVDLLRVVHDPHLFGKPGLTEGLSEYQTLPDLPEAVPPESLIAHQLRFWRELLPGFRPCSLSCDYDGNRIVFSPDNRWACVEPCLQQRLIWENYDWRNHVQLAFLDVASAETVRLLKDPELSILTCATFSPTSSHLAWGGSTQSIGVLSLADPTDCWAIEDSPPELTAICLSSKSSEAVLGAADGTILVCNWKTSEVSRSLSLFEQQVEHLEFSPDGRWLLAASRDGQLKLIDAASYATILEFSAHRERFLGGTFIPDGTEFISLGYAEIPMGNLTGRPAEMIRWSLPDGVLRESLLLPDGLRINSVSAAPDRRSLAFTSRQGVFLAAIASKLSYQTLLEKEETGEVVFLPDGTRLLVAGEICSMGIFDLPSLGLGEAFLAIKDGPTAFAFNSSGSRMIRASSYDAELELFDVATGRYLRQFFGHVNAVNRVLFTPDDQRILSAGRDGTLKIWEAETGDLLASIVVLAEPNADGCRWECLKQDSRE